MHTSLFVPKMISLLAVLCLSVCAVDFVEIQNADFEKSQDGLAEGWKLGPGFRAERGVGHNGNGGLVWESEEPSAKASYTTQYIQLETGMEYDYSVEVRTENYHCDKRIGGVKIGIKTEDENGKELGVYMLYFDGVTSQNSNWVKIGRATRAIKPAAKKFKIFLLVPEQSKGKVFFDRVRVSPVIHPPVDFVCTNAYRDTVAEGDITFFASINPPKDSKNLKAVFTWAAPDGTASTQEATLPSPGEARLTVPVASLAKGTHDVTCSLLEGDKALGFATIAVMRVDQLPDRKVWIDRHNRCIVNGKPFFPLGMYFGRVTEKDLDTFAKGPFNCLMPYGGLLEGKVLDWCKERGLMAFCQATWAGGGEIRSARDDAVQRAHQRIRETIAKYKNHHALLGWYTADEAPVSETKLRAKSYQVFKECDPDHPTWIVQDSIVDLRPFTPTCDVVGVDPYPIPREPIDKVTRYARGANEAMFGVRPMWNVPQAFDWGWARGGINPKAGRFPTDDELQSIFWQHIACGVNGLIAYGFHCYVRDYTIHDFDKYWGAVCKVATEVKKREQILLSVEESPQPSGAPDHVPCRTWKHDGFVYLLMANSQDKVADATITVGNNAWQSIALEFGEPAKLLSDGKIQVLLPPIAVSMVKLK